MLKIAKKDQLTLKAILAYTWTSLILDEQQKTRLAGFATVLTLAMKDIDLDGLRKLLQPSDQQPIGTVDGGGSGNADTIGRGSLASPTPPGDGDTNERSDTTHETEEPTDRRNNEDTMTLTLGPKTFRDVLESATYFDEHYFHKTVDRVLLLATQNEIRGLLKTLRSAADIDGNKVFAITERDYLTMYFTYRYAERILNCDEQQEARYQALRKVKFHASTHQHVADEEPRAEE